MPEQRLVVFADYTCPFCRLAGIVLRRLRSEGVSSESAAFELRPPGTPLPLVEDATRPDTWRALIDPLAAELGVTLKRPSIVTRTRKAHEAVAHARSEGFIDAMHEAVYAAYWEEGQDIGRIDVLVDIGRVVGLDATGLRVALDIDRWTAQVERQEAWAARLGVAAVPAYVRVPKEAAGMAVAADVRIGLLRYEELRAWMDREHDV